MIVGPWTLVLKARSSSASDTLARLCWQDSSDNFNTNIVGGPEVQVFGANAIRNMRRWTFTQKDFPELRIGQGGVTLRLALLRLSGTSPQITYESWIES